MLFMELFISFAFGQKREKSYYEKALAKIEAEDYEGAIADLDKAIEADSSDFDAFFKRGYVKALLLNHADALPDFTRAIQLHPDEPQYYSERGIAKLHLQDNTGACEDLKKAASMGFEPAKELAYEYCP